MSYSSSEKINETSLDINPTNIDLGQVSSNYKSQNQQKYLENGQIKLFIPSFAGFMDAKSSYLKFNVLLSGNVKSALTPKADAHGLFSTISIYDGTNSTLIERIENYPLMVSAIAPYTENQSIINKKQLLEARSDEFDMDLCPFFDNPKAGSPNTDYEFVQKKVAVCLQLQTGIFTSENLIPIMALEGLNVVIDLNTVKRAIKVFPYGVIGTGTAYEAKNKTLANDGAQTTITVKQDISKCGFIKGQTIVYPITGGVASRSGEVVLTKVSSTTADETVLTFAAVDMTTDTIAVDAVITIKDTELDSCSFEISDVELSIKDVTPPKQYMDSLMKAMNTKDGYNFDIKTYDLYKNNLVSSELTSNMFIPCLNHRAVAIMSLPMNNSDSVDVKTDSYQTILDACDNYVYSIHGKHQPNQKVDLTMLRNSRTDQLQLFELSKAIEACGYSLLDVRDSYKNFIIARSVGRMNSTSNLSDGSLNLEISYLSTAQKNKLFHHYVCHKRRVILHSGVPPLVIM